MLYFWEALKMITALSAAVVPAVVGLAGILILISKKPMFDIFISGIKSGFETAVGLFPTLCALCCAVAMLNACGFTDAMADLLVRIGIPKGLGAFTAVRPISGSASTAMLADIFASEGPDSLTGIAASVMMATSDTVIYIISVYHGAAGIKNSRFTLIPAAISAVVTAVLAIWVSGRMFG